MGRSSTVIRYVLLLSGSALLAQASFAQQSIPAAGAAKGPKLCVASVGNGSLQPIQVNEVNDELLKKLLAAGLNVDSAGSATQVAKTLDLSGNNLESIRLRKCDYMLLTAVDSKPVAKRDSGTKQTPAASGEVSEGGVLLSYALFQKKVTKALVDTSVEAPAADSPTHSIVQVIDQEVEAVRQLIPKK